MFADVAWLNWAQQVPIRIRMLDYVYFAGRARDASTVNMIASLIVHCPSFAFQQSYKLIMNFIMNRVAITQITVLTAVPTDWESKCDRVSLIFNILKCSLFILRGTGCLLFPLLLSAASNKCKVTEKVNKTIVQLRTHTKRAEIVCKIPLLARRTRPSAARGDRVSCIVYTSAEIASTCMFDVCQLSRMFVKARK